jgi:DNA-binding NtrC family response regulator
MTMAQDDATKKTRLLIVDDDSAFQFVLRDTLLQEGYSVAVASDGHEALTAVKKEPFDLILLDIFMPGIDGFGVLKWVKQNIPKLKVIMITGYADLKLAVESKRLGAENFVAKPYMRKDLLDTIQAALA